MIAFLTSSPCVIGADRAILNPENDFVEHIRQCLPDSPRCLFVCSDPDNYDMTDGFARDMTEAFREVGIEFSDAYTLDGRNGEDAQLLIWQSDLIILSGGHVPTQNAFFQEIELREKLENFQGVLMGISAGSMNAADRVYVQPEEEGESAPEFERFLPGLGITDVNILPHYQQVKDNILDGMRLFEDVTYADSMGECFFALVDGSYFCIEEGETTLYGEAYCISDGEIEQISEAGDIVIFED